MIITWKKLVIQFAKKVLLVLTIVSIFTFGKIRDLIKPDCVGFLKDYYTVWFFILWAETYFK